MKVLELGDPHLRTTRPAKRIDNFEETQYRKLMQVFEIGAQYKAPILCTGDLSDIEAPSLTLLVRYLPAFLRYPYGIYVVPGNHDVDGANLKTHPRTAFGVFVAAGAITPLGHIPTEIGPGVVAVGHTYMHQDPPPAALPECFNILVSHEMVIEDKLFPEQESFTLVQDHLNAYPEYDHILCGHYHYRFAWQDMNADRRKNRVICNPGALVRIKASVGDMALLPGVFLFDTDTQDVRTVILDHEPASTIFAPAAAKMVPAYDNKQITAFAGLVSQTMTESGDTNFSSLSALIHAQIAEAGCDRDVADLIIDYMSRAGASS
jgi:DNA repair exonuclease SbcCD nuclease subunit